MTGWMFANPRRMVATLLAVVAVSVLVMLAVLTIKWHGQEAALRGRFATPTVTRLPLDGGSATTSPTPLPSAPPSLGDPRPVVLDAVNAWLAGKPVADHMDPAAYEDVVEHAAPAGLAVTEAARLENAGPEGVTVLVPLGGRTLAVDVAAEQGQWMVTALGWQA